MYQNLKNFLFLSIALLIVSCNNSFDEKGKWSFKTTEGNYSELWMDGENLVIINRHITPSVYYYEISGDSVKMYDHKGDPKNFDAFVITERGSDFLKLNQHGHNNTLTLIEHEIAPVKDEEAFYDKLRAEFESRANTEKN